MKTKKTANAERKRQFETQKRCNDVQKSGKNLVFGSQTKGFLKKEVK